MKRNREESDDGPEIIRGDGKKKKEDLSYCKWAAHQWEAEYYLNTPAHVKSRARSLKVLMNDPCWYSTLPKLKTDAKKMQRRPAPGKGSKKQDSED